MKILYCTQKLSLKLPEPLTEVDEFTYRETTQGLGNWYANTFLVNRKTHILFTNEKTLYSFAIPEARKEIFKNIHSAFLRHLESNLNYENIDKTVIQKIISEYDSFVFSKTLNKSILGCMRDVTYHYQYDFHKYPQIDDVILLSIVKKINRVPHKIKDYFYPIELLKELITKEY